MMESGEGVGRKYEGMREQTRGGILLGYRLIFLYLLGDMGIHSVVIWHGCFIRYRAGGGTVENKIIRIR